VFLATAAAVGNNNNNIRILLSDKNCPISAANILQTAVGKVYIHLLYIGTSQVLWQVVSIYFKNAMPATYRLFHVTVSRRVIRIYRVILRRVQKVSSVSRTGWNCCYPFHETDQNAKWKWHVITIILYSYRLLPSCRHCSIYILSTSSIIYWTRRHGQTSWLHPPPISPPTRKHWP